MKRLDGKNSVELAKFLKSLFGVVAYTDSFRSYDGLVLDRFKHFRINHQEAFATSKRQSRWADSARTHLHRILLRLLSTLLALLSSPLPALSIFLKILFRELFGRRLQFA